MSIIFILQTLLFTLKLCGMYNKDDIKGFGTVKWAFTVRNLQNLLGQKLQNVFPVSW